MADDDDLQELHDGSVDLARRDFRGADLSGLDLSDRDISGAHLERANLAGANLSRSVLTHAKTSGMNAEGANLSYVKLRQTSVFGVNFRNSTLCQGDFVGSHFTRCDLTGADLRGASFQSGVLNEGTTFEGCIIDEYTRFDGASILRQLSRQDAFRFYRVERGVLKRKEDEEPQNSSIAATTTIYNPNPLQFPESAGEATFDYTNNDGRADFGQKGALFKTKWSKGGKGSIHAYLNQPSVTGIAIAKNAVTFEEITTESLSRLDFTSRTRAIQNGQFLIVRNADDQVAAFMIKDVMSTSHGDPRDELSVQYRILGKLTDYRLRLQEYDVRRLTPNTDIRRNVNATVDELLAGLALVEPRNVETPPHAGLGHNNPPEETPIDRRGYDETVAVLRNIKIEVANAHPDVEKIEEAKSLVSSSTVQILRWASRKLDLAAEEFSKEAGKSLGNTNRLIAMWLACSTQMTHVVHAITTFVAALLP